MYNAKTSEDLKGYIIKKKKITCRLNSKDQLTMLTLKEFHKSTIFNEDDNRGMFFIQYIICCFTKQLEVIVTKGTESGSIGPIKVVMSRLRTDLDILHL